MAHQKQRHTQHTTQGDTKPCKGNRKKKKGKQHAAEKVLLRTLRGHQHKSTVLLLVAGIFDILYSNLYPCLALNSCDLCARRVSVGTRTRKGFVCAALPFVFRQYRLPESTEAQHRKNIIKNHIFYRKHKQKHPSCSLSIYRCSVESYEGRQLRA